MDSNLVENIKQEISQLESFYNLNVEFNLQDKLIEKNLQSYYPQLQNGQTENLLDTFNFLKLKLKDSTIPEEDNRKFNDMLKELNKELYINIKNSNKDISSPRFFETLLKNCNYFNDLKQNINKLINICNTSVVGEIANTMSRESIRSSLPYEVKKEIASYLTYKGGKKVNKKRKTKKRKTK